MPVTEYTWDPTTDSVLEETDGAGHVLVSYTNEPSQYGPLISQHRDGESHFFHFDALGSTRELTDHDENVTDTFAYDAWGNVVQRTGVSKSVYQWIGNLGYRFSHFSSLIAIRERTYSPVNALWCSADPLFPVIPRYTYAANNPVFATDPEGLAPITFQFTAFIRRRGRSAWFPEPGSPGWAAQFRGDHRSFNESGTYRLQSIGSVDSCDLPNPGGSNNVGASHRRHRWMVRDSWTYDPPRTAPLAVNVVHIPLDSRLCGGHIEFEAAAAYPYSALSPQINMSVNFDFTGNDDHVEVSVSGRHDKFPDYEVIVDGMLVYKYPAPYTGPGLFNLWLYGMVPFSRSATVRKQTGCRCNGTCPSL